MNGLLSCAGWRAGGVGMTCKNSNIRYEAIDGDSIGDCVFLDVDTSATEIDKSVLGYFESEASVGTLPCIATRYACNRS